MGKRELVALLDLSSWCLVIVVWLFLAVSCVCLQFVIVVFPDNTHLLFFIVSHSSVLKSVDFHNQIKCSKLRGGSICNNENAFITPSTNALEFYFILYAKQKIKS